MNIVRYIRVSTQGKTKEDYSLKCQEDEIKVYSEEQGLYLISIFREEFNSGVKLNGGALEKDRISLQEMLAPLVICPR
ncbi:recombinase family protein [Psychrobacillus sp. FSL W7-1457]|uniref:recombinase family protein n=1 Tax=Psychrobacillus sp. FSL W7-1457 TaxID=2954547 RepID=UPI00315A5183